MTTITALPAAPDRSNPSSFATLADSFVDALPTMVTQINTVSSEINTTAAAAAASASAASASASSASASANGAAVAASVYMWVSGTTYSAGVCVWSPTDYQTYRRKTSGAGTTDPVSDSSNWQKISGANLTPMMHVVDQKADGTSGGSSSIGATFTRTLNTTRINTISGASLASDTVTLPAGTYDVDAIVPGFNSPAMTCYLYNSTDAVDILLGSSFGGSATYPEMQFGQIKGRFTLSSTKNIQVKQMFSSSTITTTDGLGRASANGKSEVYTQLIIKQVG